MEITQEATTTIYLHLKLDLKNRATVLATSRKMQGKKGTLKDVVTEALEIGLQALEEKEKEKEKPK